MDKNLLLALQKLEELENECCKCGKDPFAFCVDEAEELKRFWNDNEDQVKTNGKTCGKTGGAEGQKTEKAAEKCSLGKILRDMQDTCCKKECVKGVSPQTVLSKRTLYWEKSCKDRMAYVYHAIETGKVEEKGNLLMVESGLVCTKAWCIIHAITPSCFYERLAEVRKGEKKEDKPRQRQKTLAYDLAVEWFRNFAKNADYMPNSSTRTLPSCLSKLAVYQLYKDEMGDRPVLDRSHFIYHMWKTEFPNVFIPKGCRFTKCSICVHLAERLRSPGLSEEKRQELTLMRKVHLTQQMTEREKYYKHGEKAKKNPKKYLSVTIDGMDQNKHNLPHFNISTKTDGSAWRLKTHVTGVLNNHHTRAFAFLDMCEWPHGSNLTINVLVNVLLEVKNSMGELPPNAYIQMDNTSRECKNQFILAFLCILVEMRVFDKIKLSFLMVGHTHEDIDQMFSCVARRLLKNDARTLDELKQEIKESYTPKVEVHQLDAMFDVKSWMDDCHDELTGHSAHHQFKIERNDAGDVVVYYKKWSTSTEWLPEEGITLTTGIPEGEPDLVRPNIANLELDKIKSDLPKFRLKFDQATNAWWNGFIRRQENRHDEAEWKLSTLAEKLQKPERVQPTVYSAVDEELRKLIEKEEREVEVRVRRKRRGKKKEAEEQMVGTQRKAKKRKSESGQQTTRTERKKTTGTKRAETKTKRK